MRNKFIPLAVALVFGSIAAVGFTKMNKAAPEAESVEIYVAARVIEQSEELKQDAVKLETWPADKVPQDAARTWKELEGKFVNQRIFDDEPVVGRKLMDSKMVKTVNIPKGFNVVTLKTDEASSVANLVSPGDRVNVIGYFKESDVIPETMTRTVLSGVKVFAVDGRTTRAEEEKSDPKAAAKTVSLLIHTADAEVWTWAKESAKISLSLGRPDDGESTTNGDNGPNPAGQQFLAWLAEHQAKKNLVPEVFTSVQAPVAEPKTEVEHRMVKFGTNGEMVTYTWEKGNPVPFIVTTGGNASGPAIDSVKPAADLSYLNGQDSPLYSDPANDDSVDNPNYNPFEKMQQ